MNHIPFTATPAHRRNLIRLAQYLYSGKLVAEFDMARTTSHANILDEAKAVTCGKVGDVIGQAPHAGIWKARTENWLDYTTRCFFPGFGWAGFWICENGWAKTDNSPEGAARRIVYLLVHGVPTKFFEARDAEGKVIYDCNPEFYAGIPSSWIQVLATYPQLQTPSLQ